MLTKRSVAMVLFAVAALALSPVSAQPGRSAPPPGCRAWDADLPSQWAPWGDKPAAVTAASSTANAAHAMIAVSKKYAVTLVPAKDVHMAVETPDADPPPNAHKGILSLRIPTDGTYWIAASGGLWIDVVSGGAIVESTDHGPGPQCASIAKSVQFMLKAGDTLIQLSDNRGAQVDLMVTLQK
jgi:hypothetical protein